MVATATRTILENLDRIPDEDDRTKIAIICYDVSLYFFSMTVSCPRMTDLPVGLNASFSAARINRIVHARCIGHRRRFPPKT